MLLPYRQWLPHIVWASYGTAYMTKYKPLLFQLLLRQVQFKNGITLSRAITQDIENVEQNFQVVKCSIMGVKMTKQKFPKIYKWVNLQIKKYLYYIFQEFLLYADLAKCFMVCISITIGN